MEGFQQRLYELRRQAGLSQEELADLLGVTRQAVQKWEAGSSRPDMDNLAALADYFGVTLDYLTGRAETDAQEPPIIVHQYYSFFHYEYKSKRTFRGLPLVHINLGHGLTRAKGVIAIGNIATGIVALGGIAVGLFSLGGISLGLLALGALVLGCLAIGGVAVGLAALGGVTVALLAMGGVAIGCYAMGGVALASRVAVGGVATAPLAIGVVADGIQTFSPPLEGFSPAQLADIRHALAAACQDAPNWLFRLLLSIAKHLGG